MTKNEVKTITKNEKFRKLATKRTQKVLKGIKQLENLTSNNYESSYEEKAKIIDALQTAINELTQLYNRQKTDKEVVEFSL